MAAKKRSTSVKKTPQTRRVKKESTPVADNRASRFPESYTSLIIGAVVVILLVILLVSFVRERNVQNDNEQAASSTNTESGERKTYIVQSGDDLWNIAENEYDNGYEWVTIAEENNLEDPNTLPVGTELVLPSIDESRSLSTTASATPMITPGKKEEGSEEDGVYTIKEGDTLWDISIQVYGDGYGWVQIAQANNLPNPDLIYPGTELTIPQR